MSKPENPAAFPQKKFEPAFGGGGHWTTIGGMTLRDWFAGQALATMKLPCGWSDNPHYWEGVARSAYTAADAMLAERAKEG